MGLKAGLNQNDKNRMRKMLEGGASVEEIARACKTHPEVIEAHLPNKKAAKKKADADKD